MFSVLRIWGQNDNGRYCQDPAELAVIAEEGGTAMGPLLRAVNQIAEALAADFPLVAVDTLAYEYSQPPDLFWLSMTH